MDAVGDEDLVFLGAFFAFEVLFFEVFGVKDTGEGTLLFVVFDFLGCARLFARVDVDGGRDEGEEDIVTFESLCSGDGRGGGRG